MGVQHLASIAIVRHIAGRQHPRHILLANLTIRQMDVTGQTIAARTRTRKTGNHMVNAGLRHFLRGLDGGADRAFGFLHGINLAKPHTT